MKQRFRWMLQNLLESLSALSWLAVGTVVTPLSAQAQEETEPGLAVDQPRGHPEGRSGRPLTPTERELMAGLGEIDWW